MNRHDKIIQVFLLKDRDVVHMETLPSLDASKCTTAAAAAAAGGAAAATDINIENC